MLAQVLRGLTDWEHSCLVLRYVDEWSEAEIARYKLSFDNMDDRPIQGTQDWHPYSVILDVPPESTNIAFGILLTGPGEAWLTELAFEEVCQEVSVTGGTRLPQTEPQNLSFEAE